MKKLLLLLLLSPLAALCQTNTLPVGAGSKPAPTWFMQGSGATSRLISYSGGYYYPYLTVQDTLSGGKIATKHELLGIGGLIPTNGLQKISGVKDSIGLGAPITSPTFVSTSGQFLGFGSALSGVYINSIDTTQSDVEIFGTGDKYTAVSIISGRFGAKIAKRDNNTDNYQAISVGDKLASGNDSTTNQMLQQDERNHVGIESYADYSASYPTHPLALAQVNYVNSTAIAKADSVKNSTTFATIADMQAYTGTATSFFVTDSLRGGPFNFVASGLVTDGGVVIPRTSGGFCVRQYDVSKGVNVSWWGTSTASWNTAIKYAGAGGTINAVPKYVYPQTDEIIPLLNQTINGNGATLQRQHEASVLNTAIVNSTDMTITVASIPSTWKVGDFLQIWVTQSSVGCTLRNKITNITGNVVTLQYAVGTGQYNSQTSWAIGTAHVRKVFHQITGVINTAYTTNGSLLSSEFEINNLNFDGNYSITSDNVYWGVNTGIFAQSYNQHIKIIGCQFLNMPNDIVNGHGFYITKCFAKNSNNSFVHLSGDYSVDPKQIDSHIFDNSTDSTNRILSATGSMHSEGVITLSFSGGYVSIHDNNFKGGLDCALGMLSYSPSTQSGASRYLLFHHNKCFNFSGCFAGYNITSGGQLMKPGNIIIDDNIFSNCKTTSPFPATGSSNWALIDKTLWSNNILSDGTTVTTPIEVLNTTDYITNNTGATTQTAAIKISGAISGGAVLGTSLNISGGTSTVQSLIATGDVTLNSGSTATYGVNYLVGGLGQTTSITTMKAKNTSRGNTIGSLSNSTSLFLQGIAAPDNITTIRPEISMYRGANANPEAVFRQHTTSNTGFELAVGNGSVAPVTVAEGVYNTTSTFRIPSGVNFNLLGLTTVNGVLYGSNASGQVAQTAQGASGTVLHGGGATAPAFGQVVGADMAAQTITYSKIQVGTTGKLYGTASGTTFAEVTLGPAFSFTGTTLNIAGGQTTLVAGTKAITITGLTTSGRAKVTFVSIGGTVSTTWQYAAVCTANTLTITALTNAGTTNTTDTSVLNYSIDTF